MSIIKYPLSTEKTIRLMESNNTLIFVVDKKADKKSIKEELEKLYNVKIESINTVIDTKKNRKKAYVKFSNESPAIDLATQLGLM
ncbi:MAG: 50S ribosomal protein L23 [Candidatus Woesearchaeota archaeon]